MWSTSASVPVSQAGVTYTTGNYAGDVMHFGLAASRLAAEGVPSHHDADSEELREKMKDSTDLWRSHGFDLDFSELVFLGERAEVTEYLRGHGWTADGTPTNDLLVRYGLPPMDPDQGFADVVYVSAAK